MTNQEILKNLSAWALRQYHKITQGKLSPGERQELIAVTNKTAENVRILGVALKQVADNTENIDLVIAQAQGIAQYLSGIKQRQQETKLTAKEIEQLRDYCNKIAENTSQLSQIVSKTGLGYGQSKLVLDALKAWQEGKPTPTQYKKVFR